MHSRTMKAGKEMEALSIRSPSPTASGSADRLACLQLGYFTYSSALSKRKHPYYNVSIIKIMSN